MHGYFRSCGNIEFVYSVGLIFAGVTEWIRKRKMEKKYGNGIVTVDEISRMDLHSVELVVISACWSSRNQIIEDKGYHGLIGAFSEAGVHYVISHLWSADDFSSIILMDHFYYQYTQRKLAPPAALNLAKKYLRKITIRQMRKEGWFDCILQSDLDMESKAYVQKYEKMDDMLCPFENEIYWGGFSCYRCN